MWIRDRFERTISDLTLWMKLSIKAKPLISSPVRFFHYKPLFTSSFSKNLIISEAVMFSKGESVTFKYCLNMTFRLVPDNDEQTVHPPE